MGTRGIVEWIDLTQTLGPDCPTRPPNRPAPEFESYADADGYNGTRLHLDTHCRTHMDAPTHFLPTEEGRTIDEVTPAEMVTEGVVLDFADLPPGAEIGRDASTGIRPRQTCRLFPVGFEVGFYDWSRKTVACHLPDSSSRTT